MLGLVKKMVDNSKIGATSCVVSLHLVDIMIGIFLLECDSCKLMACVYDYVSIKSSSHGK